MTDASNNTTRPGTGVMTPTPLFPHQELALQRLHDNPRYMLAMDMGSG